jgi:hypothetical protein
MKRFHHQSCFLAAIATASVCFNPTPIQAATFTTTEKNDPTSLINALLGDTTGLDITSFKVQTIGNAQAFGTFQKDPFGLGSGVVLSTGKVTDLPSVNKCYGTCADVTTDFGTIGVTNDTTQLRIDFTDNTATTLYFQYVFGSEELPEWAGSVYNDSFSMTLNGQSLAKLSNGSAVNINNLANSNDLILNPPGTRLAAQETKLDGFTKPLLFAGALKPGQINTLLITIGDVGDGIYDSAVFLKGGTLGTVKPPDITGIVTGCSGILGTGGAGLTRNAGNAGVPTGSDTGTFNCTNIPDLPPTPTPTAVPEPFTIIGTLMGGAAAYRMRKRYKATNKM